MAFSATRSTKSSKPAQKRLRASKEIGKTDGVSVSPSSDTSAKGIKNSNGSLRPNARISFSVVLRSADIRSRLRDASKSSPHISPAKNQKRIKKKPYRTNRNVLSSEDRPLAKKPSVSPNKASKEVVIEKIESSPKRKDEIIKQSNDLEILAVGPCSSQSLCQVDEEFPAFDNLSTRGVGINNSPHSLARHLLNGMCTPMETTRMDITDMMDADKDTEHRDRRKFYIVQNGGSPAEMYCTDLVHKAKHGYNRARNLDERRLMKCTDKWREEWNHGVQMPLSRERPIYCFENIRLFPDVKIGKFELPKKYIALNERRYTKNASQFERRKRLPLFQYEIDSADEDWLSSKEGNHVSHEHFLSVMNRLEIDYYKNIHLTILEQLTFSRDNAKTDDDADCDICCMPEWEPGDEIVFCDDCNISVHQSCYGLDSVPTDDWMCATCIHRCSLSLNLQGPPPCIFCPILGGAMKCTKNCESWAHVVCALWIPEVRFTDIERREPITHVSDVPADRWKAKCSVCDTSNGACIRCTHPGCNVPFHVSCAQRSGLTLQIEQSAQATNGVKMTSLCSNHSFLSPNRSSIGLRRSSSNFTTFDRNQLSEMKQNFFKHVDLQKISEETGISEKIINDVFMYWHWKRKLNACQPLLVEPLEFKISVQPRQIRTPQQLARQKSNAFNSLPSEDLLNGFEKIRTLRLNLEKARNLCYMVSRREKLKRAQFETFAHSTTTLADLLLDSVVPCSKRRTEKLLEVWDSTNKEMFANEQHSEARSNTSASPLKLANTQEVKAAEKLPSPTAGTNNNPNERSPRKASLYVNVENGGPRYATRELPSPASANVLNGVNLSAKNSKKSVLEEQRRREELYEFRSSSSPLLSNEAPQNSRMPSVREEVDNGNVSDASNFSEYSVAWSNASENESALFNFENEISPMRLSNGQRKKKKILNGKMPLNDVLKVKKVNFKDERKKSGLNGWKGSGEGDRYVLHHPELREEMKSLPPRRPGRTSSRRI